MESSSIQKEKKMVTLKMESSSITAPVDPSSFNYTASYCEENMYLLCKKLCSDGLAHSGASDLFVVFISNDMKQIPLWSQKASQRADGVTLWDYHVICIQKQKDASSAHMVWDLDSTLPFPSPLTAYVAEAIRPSFKLFSVFERYFRVIHAPLFLRRFASDRRHMKDSAGNWTSQPPSYPPIAAEDGTAHNLNEYINISSAEALKNIEDGSADAVFSQNFGVVVGEGQLDRRSLDLLCIIDILNV